MSRRIACAIEGCAASRGLRKEDRGALPVAWICGAHWATVPDEDRTEYRRLQRLERRHAAQQHGAPPMALADRADAAWARCVAGAGGTHAVLHCDSA